ncbi:MAG: AraC family transcriptional regulator [bacterium]|nr:AraC family transcriptional regulator [bacterium]
MPEEAGKAPEVSYLRPAALPGIMLVTAKFDGPMPPSTIDRRWTFCRTDEGDGDVSVGRVEVRLQPGTLLALEPGDCVAPLRRRTSGSKHRTLLVEPEYAADFVKNAFPDGGVKLRRGLLGEAAVRTFDNFFEAVSDNEPALEQEGLLSAFLEAASDDTTVLATAAVTPPVARAKKFIEDRFADDVRLEHLEAEVGLSRFYLVRRFRAEVGMPPHAFQLALRLDRARVLVASGMALADVASRCGFTDQSHLTRHFRRATGVAPGAYARSAGVRR